MHAFTVLTCMVPRGVNLMRLYSTTKSNHTADITVESASRMLRIAITEVDRALKSDFTPNNNIIASIKHHKKQTFSLLKDLQQIQEDRLNFKEAVGVYNLCRLLQGSLRLNTKHLKQCEKKSTATDNLLDALYVSRQAVQVLVQLGLKKAILSEDLILPITVNSFIKVPLLTKNSALEDSLLNSNSNGAFASMNEGGQYYMWDINGRESRDVLIDTHTSGDFALISNETAHRYFQNSVAFSFQNPSYVALQPSDHTAISYVPALGFIQSGKKLDDIINIDKQSLQILPVVGSTRSTFKWITYVQGVVVGGINISGKIKVCWDTTIPISYIKPRLFSLIENEYKIQTHGINSEERYNSTHEFIQKSPTLIDIGILTRQDGFKDCLFTSRFSLDNLCRPFALSSDANSDIDAKMDDCDLVIGLNFITNFATIFDIANNTVGIAQQIPCDRSPFLYAAV